MSKVFDLDGPVLGTLNKIADLLWLNILTLVFCIPIVTIGASLSASHYVCLKMYRKEGGYVTRDFMKAFKMNLIQGSAIGVFCLILVAVFVTDFLVTNKNFQYYVELPALFHVVILAAFVLFLFFFVWVFAMQAKFINPVPRTIKNAFAVSMIKFPQTVAMVVIVACPWVALWLTDLYLLPVVMMFGISVPVYCSAALYSKFFEKLEENIRAKQKESGEDIAAENAEEIKEVQEDAKEE